jgi:hypothetical protein
MARTNKSVVFLYNNNKPFKTKKLRRLLINLVSGVKDLEIKKYYIGERI